MASSRLTRPWVSTSTVPALLSVMCMGPRVVRLAVNVYAVPVQPGPDAGPRSLIYPAALAPHPPSSRHDLP
jgi:hypothetical protein